MDLNTYQRAYVEDTSVKHYLRFFTKGQPYRLLGFIETDIHLFGVDGPGVFFPSGTDRLGRDLFSRMLLGARTSLFVGLMGLAVGFALGLFFGGLSGYYGGGIDMLIQRLIEFLQSLPTLASLDGFGGLGTAGMDANTGILRHFPGLGYSGLDRFGKGGTWQTDQSERRRLCAGGEVVWFERTGHYYAALAPGFLSYLIVHLTLAIPQMILGETALSFLGLGIQPPAVSLGTLLQDSQNVQTVTINPWLLLPGGLVVIIVIAFNFLGRRSA